MVRVAIVHYWWLKNRGGEAVIAEICALYPNADLFFHVCDEAVVRKKLGPSFKGRIFTSFISKLPFSKVFYQQYLPLMPMALENLDLTSYDIIISSESGPAKGVITRPDSVHICYCHSPMRYIWDMHKGYQLGASFFKKLIMGPILNYMRIWDVTSSSRVDYFIANSCFISQRIMKFYRRNSTVIYPPVDCSNFYISNSLDDYYLIVGELVGYKKVDLAIRAFNKIGKKLVVIGEGELFKKMSATAGSNVKLLGRVPNAELCKYYSKCKALIFPGVEDFGIVPIEAMASGRPVLAFRKGGALDYIIEGTTGLFFDEQNEDSIIKVINEFEANETIFDSEKIKNHSLKFDTERFLKELKLFIDERVKIS